MQEKRTSIVFIHGLWLHSSSWQNWMDFFRAEGYEVHAPGWPGDSATVEESRAHPHSIADVGVEQATAHYAAFIRTLPEKPLVIGHSMGGLIAEKLLTTDLARAAIAFSPAAMKGVWALPTDQIRAAWPVLKNPFGYHDSVMLTREEFRYAFGNTLADDESNALYDQFAIPAPARPILAAAVANFVPDAATTVHTKHPSRGPLYLVAGGQDHTVPASVVQAAFRLYPKYLAHTTFKEYPDRGHSMCMDHGWKELADDTLAWLQRRRI